MAVGLRYILVERGPSAHALDTARYTRPGVDWNGHDATPEGAAALLMALAVGQLDEVYLPVPRDDPGAFCDMFRPPDGFPLVGEADKDGDARPEVIARVLRDCVYVATLRQAPRPDA